MSCSALLSMFSTRLTTFRAFLALINVWSDDVMVIFFLFVLYGSFGLMLHTGSIFFIHLSVALGWSSEYSSKNFCCSRFLVGSESVPSFASSLTLLRCLVSNFPWSMTIFCLMFFFLMLSSSWKLSQNFCGAKCCGFFCSSSFLRFVLC